MTLMPAGSPLLRAKGKRIPPIVVKDGKRAYEITYYKGKRGLGGTNGNVSFLPAGFFPTEQVRFRVKVFFDESFPWGREIPKQGGKIIGLEIGTGEASGGSYSPTGATFRMTWGLNGITAPYLYPQVRRSFDKTAAGTNIGWDLLDQSPQVRAVSSVSSGVHMFSPPKKIPRPNDLLLHKGRWNQIEMFCKLNTPGQKDGILEVTVNGVTKRLTTVRYRYDDAKINQVNLRSFFGGGTLEYAPNRDTKTWFADFEFSKT
jgi:hypothetical protein